ncbi:nuclear transport factor 2 family protein [Kitasatospora sp. NPDC057692]|uniref:nuclear transport factor 2 family protein n=1 Tax=Kitasatospora sp. NPDC057692 TaxID=3346215 RepID=UPI0036C8AB24
MLVERLRRAINDHDLDGFAACFSPGYDSRQPAHPARAFTGREQVRRNWGRFFEDVPDLRAELLAHARADAVEWGEWHWHGTRRDGTGFDMRGTTVFGVQDGLIRWGRLYMEETERDGTDIDRTVRRLARG